MTRIRRQWTSKRQCNHCHRCIEVILSTNTRINRVKNSTLIGSCRWEGPVERFWYFKLISFHTDPGWPSWWALRCSRLGYNLLLFSCSRSQTIICISLDIVVYWHAWSYRNSLVLCLSLIRRIHIEKSHKAFVDFSTSLCVSMWCISRSRAETPALDDILPHCVLSPIWPWSPPLSIMLSQGCNVKIERSPLPPCYDLERLSHISHHYSHLHIPNNI